MKRVLGVVEGKQGGPLNILVGGLHGNEVAGVKAIRRVLQTIKTNRIPINGTLLGLAGNLQAIAANKRYIDYDLNRCWTAEFVGEVYHKQHTRAEDIELKSLHQIIMKYSGSQFSHQLLVDLHATSSAKGNFIVVPQDEADNHIVQSLRQPVVVDLDQHLSGTLLKYLQEYNFLAMAFEGGMIGSSKAIDLHVAGIWEILKASGAIDQFHTQEVQGYHEKLQHYAGNLPQLVRVLYHHKISAADRFVMEPGFSNFQPVKKGQVVAQDNQGLVTAPLDGMMFLPLYQTEGEDGFFIVEEVALNETEK